MTAPAGREHNALQNHHLSSPLGPEDTDSSPDTQQDARSSSANDEEGIRGPKNSQHISGALATERSQFIAPAGDIGYVQRDTNININCKRISERFLARLFLGNWNAIPSHEQPTSPGSTVQLEEYPVQRDVAPQRPLEVVSEAQLAPPPPPPAPPAPPPRKQPRISDQTSLQNQEANAALLIASPGRGWFHDRIQHFKNLPLKTRIIVVLLFIVLLGLIIVGIIVLFLTHVLPLHSSSPLPGTASSSSFAATPGSSPVYSSISATKTGTSTTGLSSLIFTNLDSTVVGVTLALVTSSTSSSSSEPSKPWTTSYIPAASSPTSTCSWGCYGWNCTLPSTPCNSLWECIYGYCMHSTTAPSSPVITPAPKTTSAQCTVDADCPALSQCAQRASTCFLCTYATYGMSCSGDIYNCCDPYLCINAICTTTS